MSKTILFQGDSITDAGRCREDDQFPGFGYPTMVKGQLGYENPGEYVFLNRGVSGDRIVDLYARIKKDIINLKPDYLSILIGINDVWHEIIFNNGVSVQKYEKIYTMLIEEIIEELPNIKIMILEPFVLEGRDTCATQETPTRWRSFNFEVREMAEAAKRVAAKFGLPFIKLQEKFDSELKSVTSDYWLIDGVHPTSAGHNLIKEAWIKEFKKIR